MSLRGRCAGRIYLRMKKSSNVVRRKRRRPEPNPLVEYRRTSVRSGSTVGYARVSTAHQSVQLQIDELRQSGAEVVFQDVQSGRNIDRPGLSEALRYVQAGDVLVVVSWDRVARSYKDLIGLVDKLRARGVALRSLRNDIDTSTPTGRMALHVWGGMAEMQREVNRENGSRGGREKARRAKAAGKDATKLSRHAIECMLSEHKAGASHYDLAKKYRVHRRTVQRYLEREYAREKDAQSQALTPIEQYALRRD